MDFVALNQQQEPLENRSRIAAFELSYLKYSK
jgi:hypothetical protein